MPVLYSERAVGDDSGATDCGVELDLREVGRWVS